MSDLENLENLDNINIDNLYYDVSDLIEKAKKNVAHHVNTEFVVLNWNIGDRIKKELLNNQKPEYGKRVIKRLSERLILKYGRGYSYSNLYRMMQLNEYFGDFKKFATLSQKLSWSHFIEIVKMDTEVKRQFYATMCLNENWSVRTLRERVDSALFERTAISKKPEQTIINDLQLAIILCASKSNTIAELMELDNSGIHVAQYLTNYVPKELLEEKFLSSIKNAKIQLEQRKKMKIKNKSNFCDSVAKIKKCFEFRNGFKAIFVLK